jgi:hypothetical protein
VKAPVGDTPTSATNRLHFRARTRDFWITGHLSTAHGRLIDVFNRADIPDLLLVEDVSIYNGRVPPIDERPCPFASVNRGNILFALPIEGAASGPHDAFAWVEKRRERVRVGTGGYEIDGHSFLIKETPTENALVLSKPTFMVLAPAILRDIDHPSQPQEHPIVLVNRALMDFVLPLDRSSAAEAPPAAAETADPASLSAVDQPAPAPPRARPRWSRATGIR